MLNCILRMQKRLKLKQIKKESLSKDMELIEKVLRSEDQIKKGKVISANINMKDEEIDDLLMHWKIESIFGARKF